MPIPTPFPSVTPRFGLPFLFAGQAQKELSVNEVSVRLDTLLHCAIESEQPNPPVTWSEGQIWLVGDNPGGVWSGHANSLATVVGGGWRFVAPQAGMVLFDKELAVFRHYDGEWNLPAAQVPPAGGTVVDVQARTAIQALVTALQAAAVIP